MLVEIAQYRPFYVGGSVTTPGAITYEPGLTVRHALILAGGLEITEKAAAGGADPLQMAARLRGLQAERFALQSLIDQLQACRAKLALRLDPAVDRGNALLMFGIRAVLTGPRRERLVVQEADRQAGALTDQALQARQGDDAALHQVRCRGDLLVLAIQLLL
ncbi:MAG: SLBB domain-containing protein, partial [Pseudomonadota bacterium]